jgi:plastocyanin
MGRHHIVFAALLAMAVAIPALAAPEDEHTYYLPDETASKIVTVTKPGAAAAGVLVLTEALAIKEAGPQETVKHFGEVYAFSPAVFAVYRNEPTLITFRNLQPDDEHDFMLVDPNSAVLMNILLPPLQDTAYVFTFHKEGLFTFYCTMHQPAMSGQILVLPPRGS